MSKGRFGGFRKGRKRYFDNWSTMRTETVDAPETIQDFDYSKAKGIWSLKSTTQFPKASPFSASHITSTSVGSTSSSYTFTAVNIGTESSYRTVVVAISWNAGDLNRFISSASIGGISATVLQTTAAAGWERSAIIYASVPSGTTANIVLNFNGTITYGIAIGIFRLINVTTVTSPVFDVHNNTTTTYTTNISVNAGDYIISALGVGNGVANWTNTTERYSYTKFNDYLEGASTTAASTGSLSISATGSTYGVLTTVAFR